MSVWCRRVQSLWPPHSSGETPHYWAGQGETWQKKYLAQALCRRQRGQRSARGRALPVGHGQAAAGLPAAVAAGLELLRAGRCLHGWRQEAPAGETDFSTRERLIPCH